MQVLLYWPILKNRVTTVIYVHCGRIMQDEKYCSLNKTVIFCKTVD